MSILNVYAPQDDGDKRKLWVDACSYLTTSYKLFCLMGDFNSVRKEEERFGCNFYEQRAADFNAFINAADLQYIHMGGHIFTLGRTGMAELKKTGPFFYCQGN